MATGPRDIIVPMAAVLLAIGLSLLLWLVLRQTQEHASPSEAASLASASEALRKIADRFPGDRPDRSLSFPLDHGIHSDVPTEVWEFAGQMQTPDGHRYGFLLSFTRLALQPQEPKRPSAWAARDVYRGLFSFLDVSKGRYRAAERFARAALAMSGYDAASGLIWIDDWTIRTALERTSFFTLRADIDRMQLDLRLAPLKPAVVPALESFPATASGHFRGYLVSRLAVSGTVRLGERQQHISGQAWFNHSWGKITPPGGQVALNRYQVQLDDGRELLIVQLRRKDGSALPISSGLLIESDGRTSTISDAEVQLEPGAYWSSPSGIRYPVSSIMRFPNLGTELRLSALVENQEIAQSVREWLGLVSVSGTGPRNEPLSGQGFVNLTGY